MLMLLALIGCVESLPGGTAAEPTAITAPIVSIDSSTPGSGEPLSALILVPSQTLDGGPVGYRYAWYRDGESVALPEDAAWVPAEETAPGELWRLEVTGHQDEHSSTAGADEVTIENTAPELKVSISPVNPTSQDELSVAVSAVDADDGELTIQYTWYRDAVAQESLTGPSVSASLTGRDEEWICHVEVSDGQGGAADAWVGAVVDNASPTLTGAILMPQPAFADDELNCIPIGFEDPDGDEPEYAYQWSLDRAESGTCNCHAAEPEPILESSFLQRGYWISCEVTTSDGIESIGTIHSDAIEILNSPPTAPTVEIRPSAPAPGDDLSVALLAPASDPDGDPISYEYSWSVDGKGWGSEATVPGADVSAGQVWEVEVVASDDADSAQPASDQVTISSE